MATVEQMIALGMEFYKPFYSVDNVTGSFVNTVTILTCNRLSGKDDYKQVYFVVMDIDGNNLVVSIIIRKFTYVKQLKNNSHENSYQSKPDRIRINCS